MKDVLHDTTLRENGLPLLVPFHRWHKRLIERTAPVFVYMILTQLFLLVGMTILSVENIITNDIIGPLVLVAVMMGVTLLPFAVMRIIKRRGGYSRTLSFGAMIVFILGWIMADGLTSQVTVGSLMAPLTFVAVTLAATWLGISAIIGWVWRSLRHEFSAVGAVLGRTLPIMIGTVFFSFFAPGIWQLTDTFKVSTFFSLASVVLLIALVSSLSVARGELTHQEDRLMLTHRVQRFNVYMMIVLTQLMQAMIFFLLFGSVLLLIGWIVVPNEVLSVWLHHAPHTLSIPFIKFTLPFSLNHVAAASFVTTFASVSFLVGAATDARYRERLFDPIFKRLHELTRSKILD